ncbi:phosphatase (active on GMP and Glc-6-P) [Bacillus sp. 349Y]|nr:phosphatase (active on GMP and Glc-6-P) [Bacillus sp. 349Y]
MSNDYKYEVFALLKQFLPDEQVQDIFAIRPEDLKEKGIKAIITDLDNTLVEWDRPNATPKLIQWFKEMQEHEILVTIVSNNNRMRVGSFADPLGVPFIFQARKPMGRAFKRAIRQMDVKKEETVVIGDQLLTDVLGGNRSGFHTILVVPVAQSDGFMTKFNRKVERRIMNFFKRKGMIGWEDKK